MSINLLLLSLIIVALCFILKKLYFNSESINHRESLYEFKEQIVEKLNQDSLKKQQDLYEFKSDLFKQQQESMLGLHKIIESRLDSISNKVQENLEKGFEKSNATFQGVIERLAKIDEAQKKIESLSTNVVSLQDVLTDKKSRGIFGEVQLGNLLSTVFGERNEKVYKIQHLLSNGKIVDAALFLPEPIGLICVDSKFPLENYKRLVSTSNDEAQRAVFAKEFAKNVKKHIDDIANKYIITNETADQAILFLPAEAIFAEIHAYHSEIVDYANQKKIWLSSPTTFLATLTTVQSVLLNLERNKYMSVMHEEINKLGDEFNRYEERWNKLAKHLGTVSKDVDDIHITTGKISGRFQKIMTVDIENSEFLAQKD
ncbi:DNA recombination protein RmuC [Halobacteriovorax sp. JY17]|uniref:DNA recombination protein RmuC n=1 Tax=Halobacteriovorax sp. JY17 TaxID=2014617 RepID=UPI000C60D496|nr:DNA recombination protein RmuC [Halobacteriovorax sp. JY17]PIK15159.1 MAG: DNA recombination protein RmuC [Halobacteriovorax sp. JY17]